VDLESISIVLCGTQDSGNIGAVCRAMKNMGLSSLKLAAPKNINEINEEVIRTRAVHAVDVWESVKVYNSLRDAISDASIVVGTTRRRGKNRKDLSLNPSECAAFLKNYQGGSAALVFGNERTGLETEELALCNISSHISANPEFPSLNLSHAVQIYCYELYNAIRGGAPQKGNLQPVDRDTIDALTHSVCDSLEGIGFYSHSRELGKKQHEQFFRDIFARAGLTKFESDYLKSVFKKISHLQ